MAQDTTKKRKSTSSGRVNAAAPKRAARQSSPSPRSTRPTTTAARSSRVEKTEPVVVKHTEGKVGETPSAHRLGTWFKGVGQKINRAVRQRRFWYWVGGVVGVAAVVLLVWWRVEQSYVAQVGNQYIQTASLNEQLQAVDGSQVLDQLVQQQLVLQEAQRQHITISQTQINQELQKYIDSSGGEQAYKQALDQFGVPERLIKRQIEVRLILEQLLKDKLKVTGQEVQDYYNSNKDTLDPDGKQGVKALSSQIKDTLVQQKLQQYSQDYITTLQGKTHTAEFLNHATMPFTTFLNNTFVQWPVGMWNMLVGKK